MEIGTYLVGLASFEHTVPPFHPNTAANDICCAFFKLKEAFERYRQLEKQWPTSGDAPLFPLPIVAGAKRKIDSATPFIAVDCGAAPGGWTKYLHTVCDEVYAIDPGDM